MVESLRNEWRVLRGHPMIWVAIIAAILAGVAAIRGSPTDPREGTGPVLLWLNILFPMFILPFLAGALAPIFFLREIDHDLTEIVGSYPVTARRWLTVRVAAFTCVMMLAVLLSQLVNVAVLLRHEPGQGIGLFLDMFQWLIVLQLPNCLLWASILAWVAAKKASAGVIYLCAAVLWLGYLLLATMAGSPMIAASFAPHEELRHAMFLLDPYGGMPLMSAVPETALVASRDANVIANRIIWLASIVVLLRSIKTIPMLAERKAGRAGVAKLPRKRALPSHVGIHLRYVARDKVFALLVVAWIALILPEVMGGMDWVEPYSRVAPDSRDALNRVVWDAILGAGLLTLLYTADRVCRLYSGTKMQELYAATPHRPGRLVAVQLTSVWLVALWFVALAGLTVLVAQLAMQSPVQPAEYGRQLGLTLSRFALFAVIFVATHALFRRRLVANLVGLLVMVLSLSPLLPLMNLTHPLWRPLATTLSAPDHYWGFGGSEVGHWQFSLFWAAIAIGLFLLGIARHHRTLPFVHVRQSAVRHPATAMAIAAFAVAGVQGLSLDRTLRGEGALTGPSQRHAWRAAYETHYAQWADVAQPEVEEIKARVDFFPGEQRASMHAELVLLNRSRQPISRVLVGRNQIESANDRIEMQGATVASRDEDVGQSVFALDRPLAPGERITLQVDLSVFQSNLSQPTFPFVLRQDFSSLPAFLLLPMVGYRHDLVLRDPANREEYGLPPLDTTPPSALGAGAFASRFGEQVMIDTVVTSDSGHTAVGQGRLVRQWEEDGRNAFHYRTEAPVRAMPAYFSVPWQPQRFAHGNTDLEIYGPATVKDNDFNRLGVRDTLDFLGKEIAPYRGGRLALIAIPEIGPTGFALPQIIQVSHRFAFRAMAEEDAGFSQVYRRAAHETAHQWFGHRIGYGVLEERAFLVESLAKYAELVLVERRFGKRAANALVDYERSRYREAGGDRDQPVTPLIDAEANFDQYSRATIVFACVRAKIGDAPILEALRQSVRRSDETAIPATSLKVAGAIIAKAAHSDRRDIERLLLGSEPVLPLLTELKCQADRAP